MSKNCKCEDKSCKKITHVLFDLDGTLIDSEVIYQQCYKKVLATFGKEFTKTERLKVLGVTEARAARTLIADLNLSISENEFAEQYRNECYKLFPEVNLMPGAERLVKHLHGNNIPIAIATSSNQEAVNLKRQHFEEVFSYFHHVTAAGTDPEVKEGKPAPDVFIVCASRFPDKPKPNNILVIEDAPNGITAALAANMQAVIIPDPVIDPNVYKHAPKVLKSLLDFRPEAYGLPPFKDL